MFSPINDWRGDPSPSITLRIFDNNISWMLKDMRSTTGRGETAYDMVITSCLQKKNDWHGNIKVS